MYKDLVDRLRTESLYKDKATLEIMDLCMDAAEAIETLQSELERVKRELEERSKGCEFCRTVYVKGDWADGGAHDFRLDKCVLYYNDAQYGWEGIRIHNCPMCGRKLEWEDNG